LNGPCPRRRPSISSTPCRGSSGRASAKRPLKAQKRRWWKAPVSNRGRAPTITIIVGKSATVRSAVPCAFFLFFFLVDGRDDVHHASHAAARKRTTGIHQRLVVGEPNVRFREFLAGRSGGDDLCDDHVLEFTEHFGHVFARECAHGDLPTSADARQRLIGRSAQALTNFFEYLGIVLRHFQNRIVFLDRQTLVRNG